MSRLLKLRERKLGREHAVGLAYQGTGLIEIDSRLRGRRRLNTLIHEALHHVHVKDRESKIVKSACSICRLLWEDGWRRVEK